MSTIVRHCVASGFLFCLLLGFWFVGIVPSLDMIIGIFLLVGFVAAINYIKSSSVGKVAILFYVVLVAFIALDATYSLVPESIREELGLIRGSEIIKTAEQIHQPGGKTLQVIREQCKADFDKGLKEAVDKLRQSTSQNKTDDLIQDMQKLEERREKCSNAILALGEKGVAGKTNQATNLQDMYTYLIGTWDYKGGSHGKYVQRWTSEKYTFTENGFLLEEKSPQEPSKYQLMSRDTLRITRWNQDEKYRIMIVDHNTMQLILSDHWWQTENGYSMTWTRRQEEVLKIQDQLIQQASRLQKKEKDLQDKEEQIKTREQRLAHKEEDLGLSSSQPTDIQSMSNYLVGRWYYTDSTIGIWKSWYYSFAIKGFMTDENTKETRKYKLLSPDILQITLGNGEQQEYRIVVKNASHMQLISTGKTVEPDSRENFLINLERR